MFKALLSVLAGTFSFAVLAFVCSLIIVTGFASPGNNSALVFSATIAALLSALVFWTGSVLVSKSVSMIHGVILGVTVGVFSHPLMWIVYFALTSPGSSAPPDEPDIEAWWATVIFSFISLASYGWLTIALGATAGGLTAKLTLSIFREKPVKPIT